MTKLDVVFARKFDNSFRSLTRGGQHNELSLFRAMHSALTGVSNQFHIEEYHGGSHQVTFNTNVSYARSKARCELSDLMIIAYSTTLRTVRLTYLQAKAEKNLYSAHAHIGLKPI